MDDTASQEHRIRFYRVFVAEQSIPPEEELDEDDATAWDTVKYNPAFQGHQMRPDSLKFPVFI